MNRRMRDEYSEYIITWILREDGGYDRDEEEVILLDEYEFESLLSLKCKCGQWYSWRYEELCPDDPRKKRCWFGCLRAPAEGHSDLRYLDTDRRGGPGKSRNDPFHTLKIT